MADEPVPPSNGKPEAPKPEPTTNGNGNGNGKRAADELREKAAAHRAQNGNHDLPKDVPGKSWDRGPIPAQDINAQEAWFNDPFWRLVMGAAAVFLILVALLIMFWSAIAAAAAFVYHYLLFFVAGGLVIAAIATFPRSRRKSVWRIAATAGLVTVAALLVAMKLIIYPPGIVSATAQAPAKPAVTASAANGTNQYPFKSQPKPGEVTPAEKPNGVADGAEPQTQAERDALLKKAQDANNGKTAGGDQLMACTPYFLRLHPERKTTGGKCTLEEYSASSLAEAKEKEAAQKPAPVVVAQAPAKSAPKAPAPPVVKVAATPAAAPAPARQTQAPIQQAQTRLRRQPAEMPLMYDVKGNDPKQANLVVERLVRESLAQDPSGNGYIQGSPCTTPNDIYKSVMAYNPEMASALPNVSQLPAFLHVLQWVDAHESGYNGPYELSRMQCYAPGSRQVGDKLDPVGRMREFRLGELVWYHPNFGVKNAIFAGDCTNVIKIPMLPVAPAPQVAVLSGCKIAKAEVRPATAISHDLALRYILFKKRDESTSAACAAFLYRKQGQTEWQTPPDQCPSKYCTFQDIIKAVGLQKYASGGVDVSNAPGIYEFQIPDGFEIVFCLDRKLDLEARKLADPAPLWAGAPPDPTVEEWKQQYMRNAAYRQQYNTWWQRIDNTRGCGILVSDSDYHDKVARVFYSRADIPATWQYNALFWRYPPDGCVDSSSTPAP